MCRGRAQDVHDGELTVLLWFVGTAVVSVWFVFRDDRFDHRWLVAGVLLPDLVDAPTGGTWVMHSVVTASVLLLTVMLVTRGRRGLRNSLLALPIGVFLHLVYDGAFSMTRSFWWPLAGSSGETLPIVGRGVFNVVLEVAGATILWWCWRNFGLAERSARQRLVRDGRLSRRD